MINVPPNAEPIAPNGRTAIAWSSWFMQVFRVCFAEAQSGTTANRPAKDLWPGRPYFDTSLGANGKKIWVDKNSTGWVDGDGNSV